MNSKIINFKPIKIKHPIIIDNPIDHAKKFFNFNYEPCPALSFIEIKLMYNRKALNNIAECFVTRSVYHSTFKPEIITIIILETSRVHILETLVNEYNEKDNNSDDAGKEKLIGICGDVCDTDNFWKVFSRSEEDPRMQDIMNTISKDGLKRITTIIQYMNFFFNYPVEDMESLLEDIILFN